MKKILVAIMSLCIVGGSLPAVYSGAPECVITASAEEEYTEVTEGNLTYRVYSDHAELSKCTEDAEGEIIIADKINGVPVTSIGNNAFFCCTSLTSVTLPDSVTSIGNNAFSCCTSLTSVTLPDSVTNIGGGTFYYCTSLISITIPNSVTSIGNNAFPGCTGLTSITIPDSVTSIGYHAFDNCTSLTSINVDENNQNYKSIDGVLFDKNADTIICYPAGKTDKSYAIPDSVTSIGDYAFTNCTSLESITILNPDCEIYDSSGTICNGYNYEKGGYYFDGTIRGYDGSTAQAYAKKYGYKFESLGEPTTSGTELEKGDANGDGNVDMSDVVMVMQAYLNQAKYGVDGTSEDRITAEGEKAGDVDGKAGLTANDALLIQRYSLKLIDIL